MDGANSAGEARQSPEGESEGNRRLSEGWSAVSAVAVHLCVPEGQPCKAVSLCCAGAWGEERQVSAAALRSLLLERARRGNDLEPGEVHLHGARITGELDLSWVTLNFPVALVECSFDHPLTVAYADLASLSLARSHIPSLDATGLQTRGRILLEGTVCPGGVVLDESRVHGSVHARHATLGRDSPRAGNRALSLDGARIDADVDLTTATADGEFWLLNASLGGQLICSGARFTNPGADALSADSSKITGHVFLDAGFTAEGTVRLPGANVGGQLICRGGRFTNPKGTALRADNTRIGLGAFLDKGFTGHGEVQLQGATIGGRLTCSDGGFVNPEGIALATNNARITGDVHLDKGFKSHGEVQLQGATIGGELICSDGSFINSKRTAMRADSSAITGSVRLDQGFIAQGEVRLPDARVDGQIVCTDGSFTNPESTALCVEGAAIAGDVNLDSHFVAEGEVRLAGASIGGQLVCGGGSFNRPSGNALHADRVGVTGGVFLNRGFRAQGEVRFLGARIDGQFVARDGAFANPDGDALSAHRAVISEVFLDERFSAQGAVQLVGVTVAGRLTCGGHFMATAEDALVLDGARIAGTVSLKPDFRAQGQVSAIGTCFEQDLQVLGELATDSGSGGVALTLQRSQVTTTLTLTPAAVNGVVNLTDATVATLSDSPGSWPRWLRIDGFTYRRIDSEATDRKRIDWLKRHVSPDGEEEFAPRAYEQLATIYRATGEDRAARAVAISRGRAHSQHLARDWRGWLMRSWSRFLDVTVGYGYQPWRALIWLLAAWAPLWWLIDHAEGAGRMESVIEDPPQLVSSVYALDAIIPIVEFGQWGTWYAEPPYAWGVWAAIVLGWVLVTALVAGFTSVFRRT